MNKLLNGFTRIKSVLKRYNRIVNVILANIHEKKEFAEFGTGSIIESTLCVASPKSVFIKNNVRLRHGLNIINAANEKVVIGSHCVLAPHVTIVTNSHRSTVGKTQFEISCTHENDKSGDVIIGDDCWLGTNTTILQGVTLGRGCIVGAGAVVTKSVPPYAIVAGVPARVIAATFSKEDILEHESMIYPPDERMSVEDVFALFKGPLKGLPVYGVNPNRK